MAFVTLTNKDKAIKFLADPSSEFLERLGKEGWFPKEQTVEPVKPKGKKKGAAKEKIGEIMVNGYIETLPDIDKKSKAAAEKKAEEDYSDSVRDVSYSSE